MAMVPMIRVSNKLDLKKKCKICDELFVENTTLLCYSTGYYGNTSNAHFTCWIRTQKLDIQAVLMLATTEQEAHDDTNNILNK